MGCVWTPPPSHSHNLSWLFLWPLLKLTPSQAHKCLHAPHWYLMLSQWPLRPCCLCVLRDRSEFRPCLFSPPSPFVQGLINIWILLGLTFVLLLGLASVHNDNFLLNCFCCTLPVSLPFQKKWLQSKYQTRTVWLPARVKSDHRALWFYPASNFTSDGFQFWAKVCLLWGEKVFSCEFSTHSQRWTQLQDNLCKLSTHLSFRTVREE